MSIEAMKLALEALEEVQGLMNTSDWFNERVDALRVAIASYSAAIEDAERYEDENFKPDWMNYQEGFAAGVLEGREQMKQSAEELRSVERVEPVAWGNLANWCLDSDRVLITDKTKAEEYHRDVYDLTPLYTTPPAAPVQDIGVEQDERVFARIAARKNRDAAATRPATREEKIVNPGVYEVPVQEPVQRWAVFCGGCRKEWSVPYQHPGKSICAECEAKLREKNGG